MCGPWDSLRKGTRSPGALEHSEFEVLLPVLGEKAG